LDGTAEHYFAVSGQKSMHKVRWIKRPENNVTNVLPFDNVSVRATVSDMRIHARKLLPDDISELWRLEEVIVGEVRYCKATTYVFKGEETLSKLIASGLKYQTSVNT